jgi:short-subunit dehydrogenase
VAPRSASRALRAEPSARPPQPVAEGGGRWLPLLLCAGLLALASCATTQSTGIRGKVVVITGASSGFGKGVALKAADQGATVVLAARRTELIEAVAAEINSRGGNALAVTTDVSREEDMERLAQAALARYGRIDVWINNAGIGALGAFDEIPLADHHRVIEVNLNGAITGSHIALREFRRQNRGTLINVGSVSSEIPFPYYASYAASKHGVLGLGLSLYQELRAQGARDIHVSTILPFAADTPWFDHAAHYNGRAPRMVLMDPADKVVDAIVGAISHPRKQISVGFKARLAVASHRLLPGPSQHLAGSVMHRIQEEVAPPAPDSVGALYAPVPQGTGVDGQVRERMQRERHERRSPDPADPATR